MTNTNLAPIDENASDEVGSPAAQFLSALWGADPGGMLEGAHFIVEKTPKGFLHHPVNTIHDALAKAGNISEAGHDAYFACAEYLTPDNRKAENAAGARGFWLDIDCGESKAAKDKGYTTHLTAVPAVKDFCKATAFPIPNIIVNSGNGLHCYWTLDTRIGRKEWHRLSAKLKALSKSHNLLADPSRTADIASVLRVPGTMNWKDPENPKPVNIIRIKPNISLEKLRAAIDAAMPDAVTTAANDAAPTWAKDAPPPPEIPENIERFKSALAAISADCERDMWVRVIWAVQSTGWECAVDLAREWSLTAPDKFDADDFDGVVNSYRPGGGISIGTLFHYAEQARWTDSAPMAERMTGAGSDALTEALHEMNERYFVARIGGEVFVFDEQDTQILAGGMNFTAFKQLHAGRKVNGVNVAAAWLVWEHRRTYQSITFDPSGKTANDVFNTWRGLAVNPQLGSCSRILAHIEQVWCSGNAAQFDYVIKWLALLVQKPWIKPEVALVLRSREGTGKTIIVQILLRIFGAHGFTAAQKEQVAGRFNGHLFDKVVVVLEEAFFAGDPAAVAATKALVTNSMLGYEAKGKDAFSAANFAHVISLTNHSWAVPAGEDARRWLALDVSDGWRGDHTYFEALQAEIDGGGVAALLDYLMNVGVTGWNPRALPQSRAIQIQKSETLMRTDPVAGWWIHVLAEGAFTVEGGAVDWAAEISATEMQESYTRGTARARNAPSWDVAARKLRRLLPAGELGRVRKSEGISRVFYYRLPGLDEARAYFKEVTGVNPCEF
ncbi:MAG: DUF5906 domain-containing protein [Thiobacillaceae bacterium]